MPTITRRNVLRGSAAMGVAGAAIATAGGMTVAANIGPDAVLITAEQDITRLRADMADADDAESERLSDRMFELNQMIMTTPASTMAGAAVKLRRVLDPKIGLPVGDGAHDAEALSNVLAVVEREAGKGGAA